MQLGRGCAVRHTIVVPGAINSSWELSLPGSWSRYHGAHLHCRLQGYITVNGRGGRAPHVSTTPVAG